MDRTIPANERRLFAPEVVQTSAMDCGPAALKCLLDGFGLPVDYGRLREACQTDVDGTSIDTVEDVARQLGLVARQVLTPVDHLLLPEAALLPAVVVTVQPTGATHFVVVWRVMGPLVQIMDPATGRRWLTRQQFTQEIYRHRIALSASSWRAWAGTDGFCNPLRARLRDLGLTDAQIRRLVASVLDDPHWRPLALLDAVTRLVASLVAARGILRGPETAKLVEHLFIQNHQAEPGAAEFIPGAYWSVQPLLASRESDTAEEQLAITGAVAMTVSGRRVVSAQPQENRDSTGADINAAETKTLPPHLAAALAPPVRALQTIFNALRADGLLTPGVLIPAVILAALSVTLEAALFRGLMEVGGWTGLALGILVFSIVLFLLEVPLAVLVRRLGRRIETRLRIALLTKIPRLGDRYFHSRLISDMAHRAYSLRQLHGLPGLGANLIRQGSQLLFTAIGLLWLAPDSGAIALVTLGMVLGIAIFGQPLLGERDLRVRTHASALSRFYLDTLLGLLPIRAHSAERSMRREHEMLLVSWARAVRDLATLEMSLQAFVAFIGLGSACWIVIDYLASGGEASGVLLLLYWALNLPALGQVFVTSAQQYPAVRNHLMRILEPLGAPEENEIAATPPPPVPPFPSLPPALSRTNPPVRPSVQRPFLALQDVTVIAAGHVILSGINLKIAAGEHVAIVGASGAGKSSLVGLLLGWHRPAAGRLLVDGEPLSGERLQALRRASAWVDPAVQLWNRSLTDNLRYGIPQQPESPIHDALALADLFGVLQSLPDGLSTPLGESGGLVSGGEGQRVRLARALLRPDVRLAILDEPFRGLDRTQRRQLLVNARRHWQAATLLCITHDVTETQDFPRVLVIENGGIVEDGAPDQLRADPRSRYRVLLNADAAIQQQLWGDDQWRRLYLEAGQLTDDGLIPDN
jgi:ATP-binding cassette subfamily B protein